MKHCSLLLLLFMELALCAQQTNSLLLHFDSRSAKLTQVEKVKLEKFLLAQDRTRHEFMINIEGHTDNEGCLSYNQALSNARATAVKNFIMATGWNEELMSISFFAFNRPLADNGSENGKHLNRRVLVTLEEVKPSREKLLGLYTAQQDFVINVQSPADISYNSGTNVHIPAGAFAFKDGTPAKGTVEVQYTEYRDVGEFIASSIPMSFIDGNHELLQFNSAGMFKIEAFQAGQELVLSEGKNIDINFKRTGEVDDLGLYRFDETAKTWSLAAPATAAGAPVVARNLGVSLFPQIFSRSIVTEFGGRDSCTLAVDAAVQMAINTGLKLSEQNTAVYYKRAGQYYINKKAKGSFPSKKLLITSVESDQVRFKVLHVDDKSANGLQDFEFTYRGSDDRAFKEHWKNTFWTDVTINWMLDDDFTLFLSRNSEKVKLDVKGVYKGRTLCDQAFLTLVQQGKVPNMEIYDAFETSSKKNAVPIADILTNERCADSLFCFYTTSKRWMKGDNGENTMEYRVWLDYFNAHKPEMRERYRSLKFQEAGILAQARIERQKQRVADSIWMAGEIATLETRESLQTSISVNGLGIWNCDQLARVPEPVVVNKTYRNTRGQEVEPVLIYVIDKNVNGVLTFDGSYGMDPFNFTVSGRGENMLLALDEDKQVYICKQEWFDTAMKEDSPFLMEPLDKAKVYGMIAAHTGK